MVRLNTNIVGISEMQWPGAEEKCLDKQNHLLSGAGISKRHWHNFRLADCKNSEQIFDNFR